MHKAAVYGAAVIAICLMVGFGFSAARAVAADDVVSLWVQNAKASQTSAAARASMAKVKKSRVYFNKKYKVGPAFSGYKHFQRTAWRYAGKHRMLGEAVDFVGVLYDTGDEALYRYVSAKYPLDQTSMAKLKKLHCQIVVFAGFTSSQKLPFITVTAMDDKGKMLLASTMVMESDVKRLFDIIFANQPIPAGDIHRVLKQLLKR